MKDDKQHFSPLTQRFVDWFHARGEFYATLPVKFYMDGEPYFSYAGAEFSLRDYLRVVEDETTS